MSTTNTSNSPLYSLTTIGAGTFFGGPFAGGLMARRNLLNLGRHDSARLPMVMATLLTTGVFLGIAMVPSGVMEKLPSSVIPAAYLALIVGWCRSTMGPQLDQHKNEDKPFYSGWKALGVSLAGLLLTLGVGLSVMFLAPQSSADAAYQESWDRLVANETKAQGLADLASQEGVTDQQLLAFLDQTFLPAWEDSDQAVTEMEAIKWLDSSTTAQRTALRAYVNLQRERGRLLRQVLTTGDEAATKALDAVQAELEKIDLAPK